MHQKILQRRHQVTLQRSFHLADAIDALAEALATLLRHLPPYPGDVTTALIEAMQAYRLVAGILRDVEICEEELAGISRKIEENAMGVSRLLSAVQADTVSNRCQ